MTRGTSAPATKNDLRNLQAGVEKRIDRLDGNTHQIEQRLYGKIDQVEQRLDTKSDQVEQRLEAKMEQWKDEIIRHFDLTVETIRRHFVGANRDEIDAIKHHLARLERHTGLIAA